MTIELVDRLVERSVDLAWRSFRAGDFGIGVVVSNSTQSIVAEGLNQGLSSGGTGSRLAHGELDALRSLGYPVPDGLALTTTLEPCVLCRSAIMMSRVRRVRFAAADPLWHGLGAQLTRNEWVAEHWPEDEHLGGELGVFGALLPVYRYLTVSPNGSFISSHRAHRPEIVAFAEHPDVAGLLAHARELPVEQALEQLSPYLAGEGLETDADRSPLRTGSFEGLS